MKYYLAEEKGTNGLNTIFKVPITKETYHKCQALFSRRNRKPALIKYDGKFYKICGHTSSYLDRPEQIINVNLVANDIVEIQSIQ